MTSARDRTTSGTMSIISAPSPGGGIMTDLLHYDIGKSIFGWIAGKLFVYKKVKHIFEYRYKALEGYFMKRNL